MVQSCMVVKHFFSDLRNQGSLRMVQSCMVVKPPCFKYTRRRRFENGVILYGGKTALNDFRFNYKNEGVF